MSKRMIHIIRPIENTAEKEYIKEFFRFIGCFVCDWAVDTTLETDWSKCLRPHNEDGGIDIVLNYNSNDPYWAECRQRDIKRIYCYFDFKTLRNRVSYETIPYAALVPESANEQSDANIKATIRHKILFDLINCIWDNEPNVCAHVKGIAGIYTKNVEGDLFHLLQAKRCLRVLNMGEVLRDSSAQVSKIPLTPYVQSMLHGLWQVWVVLEKNTDVYSTYARINAASMMREIVSKLYDSDWMSLGSITFGNRQFHLIDINILIQELRKLINDHPQFSSAYLLLSCLFKSSSYLEQNEALSYLQMLQSIPNSDRKKGYAFVWYRIGYYYEKKCHDIEKALLFYAKAVDIDRRFYQALFKLGYYAAADGRFNEAEILLNQTIQAIFHGRSTDPNENGEYENWLALSLKDCQYAYKTYILLARVAEESNRERSMRVFIGKACMAATRFEEASLVLHASDDQEFTKFINYHKTSASTWAMWQVLRSWTEEKIQDFFIRDIVRDRLSRWIRA